MAKVKLDPLFAEISGTMGNLVFKKSRKGEAILARRPRKPGAKPSQAQLAQREVFKAAVAYASSALEDEKLSAIYTLAGIEKGMTAFNAAVTDFLRRQ